jgi:glycosyltransferase involved in cell wall biosynthesis
MSKPKKHSLYGRNNGPFERPRIDPEALDAARAGDYRPLAEWKRQKWIEFLDELRRLAPTEERPVWGDPGQFSGGATHGPGTKFIMAGRDDSRQKGYEVFAESADNYLKGGGEGQFIMFPIPGDEGICGLRFLEELANRHPGNVLVLPFRFREGFHAALQGSQFGCMPSPYEPFGMANEIALCGAVGVGRATGGNLHQIVPLREPPSFTEAVRVRADRWHGDSARPTGLLYRESELTSAEADWAEIIRADYDVKGGSKGRLEQRRKIPTFTAMVEVLTDTFKQAAGIYRDRTELYYDMLVAGVDHILRNFSWEKAAKEYAAVLRK